MYPFKEGQDFAREQWYVAGWADEVGRETILERWFLGEPVIFYRKQDGTPVALDGRCPHRNFPLSKGVLRGDSVECGYHGITFGPGGDCERIPSQDRIPRSCRLRAYPLVERGMLLWIWGGDPDNADPSLIPDYGEIRLDHEGWLATQGFTLDLAGRYQLLNENLMDISHLTFLHAGTIGTEALAATEVRVEDRGHFLRGTRWMQGDELTGFFAGVLNYEGTVDRVTLIDYYPPGLHVAWELFVKPGNMNTLDLDHPEENPDVLGMFRVHHMVTPATARRTNYFVAYSRNFATADESVTGVMSTVFRSVIDQDADAVVEIERILQGRAQEPDELLIKADGHSVRGRRKLQELMDRESAAVNPA